MISNSAPLILNHLWQSTVFAAGMGVLVLFLRRAQARTRYALWLAGSLKFLVPFALFMAAGSRIHWPSARAVVHPQWSAAVTQASQPFTESVMPTMGATAASTSLVPLVLWILWTCGFVAVVTLWFLRWRRIRGMVRTARPVSVQGPIRVLSSAALLEPSVFGVFRPVLLLPEGIEERLTPAQLEAVYAHELCHVRRRDNLAAAVHMLVEALFWFHPLVWWLEGRLIEERERACDEAVLQAGNHPQDYAESILEVCKLCLASPLACAAGVTGADLKKRIESIMSQRIGQRLNRPKKVLLATVGALALAAPVAIGLLNASRGEAQTKESFEVASIKPSDPASRNMTVMFEPHGRFRAEGITAKMLIRAAYDVHDFQIEGAPGWIASARYDIAAKAEDSEEVPLEKMTAADFNAFRERNKARLQALLGDRFQLKVHRETKELPVYELEVAKNGPKLQVSKAPGNLAPKSMIRMRPGQLTGTDMTMELLASNLSNEADRMVIDKTGLTGRYDFTLTWTPERHVNPLAGAGPGPSAGAGPEGKGVSDADANGPSLFTAVQEQLGLKLEPQKKGPVEALVIDRIEKPSPN